MENTVANMKLGELINKINNIDKQLLIDFPILKYYENIKAIPLTTCYAFIPKNLKIKIDKLKLIYGQEIVALYQKAVLTFFIRESLSVFQNRYFSSDIKSFYAKRFELIFEDFDNQDSYYYNYDNDFFLKDLNTCSLRLFPAGAQLVQLSLLNWYFMLRSIRYGGLNQGSLSRCLEASHFYLSRIRENTLFYEKHLDTRWLSEFSQEGWCKFYIRIAEMLRLNPQVQGIFGISWFYDPHLANISPGLLYLRKIPERGGAKVFKFGRTHSDINHAIVASQKRRKLYEEGKYKPTAYLLVWLRDDLIKWANELSI